MESFQECYKESVEQRLHEGALAREPHWTESLVVGSQSFVEDTKDQYSGRWSFDVEELSSGADTLWSVKESAEPYSPI